MELSHLSYEGDRQQDDEKRRRFNSISPVTKKAVSGWFGSTPVESSPKASTDPEYRMPVSIVAPEVSDQQSRTISHEAALHSNVWLGTQVRPPESILPISQESAMNQNEAAVPERREFQQLLERAGLDELARPLEKDAVSDRQESPSIANVPEMGSADPVDSTKSREASRANRSPRTRALVAKAAGMITAINLGQEKSQSELMRTLHKIDERMDIDQARSGSKAYDRQRFQSPFEYPLATPSAERPHASSQEEQDEADPFKLKPEEHVEHDAWHSIIVDQYGREDVHARMQYGQAFRQEQREVQQSALADTTPVTPQGDDATPQGVGVSQQTPTQAYLPQYSPTLPPTGGAPRLNGPVPEPRLQMPTPPEPSLPSGISQPQLPTGRPVLEDPQHLLPARAKAGVSLIVNPWVWLIAGLLILIFFAASLIG